MATTSEEKPTALNSETLALADKYHEIREKKRAAEKVVDDIKAEEDMVRTTLTNKMEELGLQSFKVEGKGTFYLQTSFFPKVIDEAKMIDWLDKQGATNIAPRTIHKAAFKEFYQERLEKDLPLPPAELVDAHSETAVRLRGAK